MSASFDEPLDADSVTGQTFTLTPDAGSPVEATVTYDSGEERAELVPLAPLAPGARYTAAVSTGIRSEAGLSPASDLSWWFTVVDCPCPLMISDLPTVTGQPVQDFRPGPGPFSYELGTKVRVSEPAELTALRFYKAPGETGVHLGRVWSADGQELAQATYEDETAAGWQRQALSTPLALEPGVTYVLSVGVHDYYAKTPGGLATPLAYGPLRTVDDGANGVYAATAGNFPSETFQSSNYFVDGVARATGSP